VAPVQAIWQLVLVASQFCLQLPPAQEWLQVAPGAQFCVQFPPSQEKLQVAPDVQFCVHFPPVQAYGQEVPVQFWVHPPVVQTESMAAPQADTIQTINPSKRAILTSETKERLFLQRDMRDIPLGMKYPTKRAGKVHRDMFGPWLQRRGQ
jgi:hypothetical protein